MTAVGRSHELAAVPSSDSRTPGGTAEATGGSPAATTGSAPGLPSPVGVALPRGEAGAGPSRRQALMVLDILEAAYPDARCELDFGSVFQLLVATILSAQSTDRRVNQVTPVLFALYPGPKELASADLGEVEGIIHSTGFFRVKAETVVALSQVLLADFAGRVPATLEELTGLPGVGRKTAIVVLSDGFGVPGITTDTHVLRLSRRLGWTRQTQPVKVEQELDALFPKDRWISLSHVVIWHGRRCCHARRPACGACPVAELCPAFGEGETDPALAASLIRGPKG